MGTMNRIQVLKSKLESALPGATFNLDRPKHPTGVWFLDIDLHGRVISIQWRPRLGFGITGSDSNRAYGEGPDEVYADPESTIKRSLELLRGDSVRNAISAGESLTLAQVRERLLVSQKDVAARLGVSQAVVSTVEKNPARSQLDTLQNLVAAIGATLELRIVFPDRGSIRLKTV